MSEVERFASGTRVRLQGLRSAEAFNGKLGVVLKLQHTRRQPGGTGRLVVRVDTATKLLSSSHFAQTVSAKPENLVALAPVEAAEAAQMRGEVEPDLLLRVLRDDELCLVIGWLEPRDLGACAQSCSVMRRLATTSVWEVVVRRQALGKQQPASGLMRTPETPWADACRSEKLQGSRCMIIATEFCEQRWLWRSISSGGAASAAEKPGSMLVQPNCSVMFYSPTDAAPLPGQTTFRWELVWTSWMKVG
jgi:hypothetical protein